VAYTGLISILAYILIPEVGSTAHPQHYQIVAETKIRDVYYRIFQNLAYGGTRIKWPKNIEELKEYADANDHPLDLFSTYNPITKEESQLLYFRPKSFDEDSLILIFDQPIGIFESRNVTEEDIKESKYIACYVKSGVKRLESKPPELEKSEPDGI